LVCSHLILKFLCCFFFCLDGLSIGESRVLKSHTINMLVSICTYKFSDACLMKLGVLKFGAYKLIVVISSWWIIPFINMKWPSLSLLTNFGLKSVFITSECSYSCHFAVHLLRIFFPFFCPKSMFVSISGMHFFQATKGWCMLLIQFAICHSMSFDWRNWDNWHSLLILKRLELLLKWWSACFAIMKPWVQTLVLPKKKKKRKRKNLKGM
jgi:hypothetical protein